MKRLFFLFFSIIFFIFSSCTSRQEKIDKLMKDGIEKMRINDNRTAMDDFSKIIGLAADNHEAYYYRGNASFNLKQAKEALLDYNQAIKLKPDYKEAYANRAYCKQYLKDNDGACNDFKKAVALGMPDLGDKLNMCR